MAASEPKPNPNVIGCVPRGRLYTIPDLKGRGWTQNAIDRFLRPPDSYRQNPSYEWGPPMKLYRKTRVHRVEKTRQFLEWAAGNGDRRTIAWQSTQHIEIEAGQKHKGPKTWRQP